MIALTPEPNTVAWLHASTEARTPFKDAEVGVARAGVIEPAWVAMLKRGCGIDGGHHRAGFAGEAFAVVNGPGGCRRFWDRTLQGVDAISQGYSTICC